MPSSRKLLFVPVTLGLMLCLFTVSLVVEARTDDGQKKRVEDQDEKAKKKRTEEEDDRPTSSGVSRLDEAADKLPATKSAVSDLPTAARNARHKRVKELFTDLAIPHDRVMLRGGGSGQTNWVEPLPDYVADVNKLNKPLTLSILDRASGKKVRTETVQAMHIGSILWYEKLAADEVEKFLKQNFTALASSHPDYLDAYMQLDAAEQALSAVLLYHRSARERGSRKGEGWESVGNDLGSALLGVQLAKVERLAEATNWPEAFALTRRLVDTYSRTEDRKRIAGPLTELLNKALKDANFAQTHMKEARTQLRFIEEQFPGTGAGEPVRQALRAEAESLFQRAKTLVEADKKREAMPLLRQAEEIWPDLPGLHAYRMRNDDDYQVLGVGMRDVPKLMSPSHAVTDAELRAVELIFESLVVATPEDGGLTYYRPALAEGRPSVVESGRLFRLPRQARWANGEPLRFEDVNDTVRLLRTGEKPAGWSPAWGNLLDGVARGAGLDQVKIRLTQGLLDPLGAMSFKVLPRSPDPTTKAFAEKPIGSGPFTFAGPGSENGRAFLRFEANPHYGVRDEKRGLPRIREVHFYKSDDPVADLRSKRIQVALDLSAGQATELSKMADIEMPVPSGRVPNRRVWFLAVNHRPSALAMADLRIALARAIDREKVLDQHFRVGLGNQVHKALNGPYPAGSWASDPKLVSQKGKASLDPFDPDYARARLNQALTKLRRGDLTLSLKYPAGDKSLDAAMEALCHGVKDVLQKVTLKPEPTPAHLLREEVEVTHNFELAYHCFDYVDETLWLFPLLGPQGRNGNENFHAYTGSLVGTVQIAMTLRNFAEMRRYTHAIHRQWLESEMPLIPLWQLDPLFAYDKRAMDFDGSADPMPWFHEVERWRVRPR